MKLQSRIEFTGTMAYKFIDPLKAAEFVFNHYFEINPYPHAYIFVPQSAPSPLSFTSLLLLCVLSSFPLGYFTIFSKPKCLTLFFSNNSSHQYQDNSIMLPKFPDEQETSYSPQLFFIVTTSLNDRNPTRRLTRCLSHGRSQCPTRCSRRWPSRRYATYSFFLPSSPSFFSTNSLVPMRDFSDFQWEVAVDKDAPLQTPSDDVRISPCHLCPVATMM